MTNRDSLSKLFSAVHQAVIGTDGSTIVFSNPAAEGAFGQLTGSQADELFPQELLESSAESFVCAATLRGRQSAITAVRDDELMLLFIDFLESGDAPLKFSRQIISSLRNNAMGLKMTADSCFSKLEEGQAPSEKYVSMLYHYYYRLLRTITQVDSANQLERGELLFSPAATDLVALCADLTDTVSVLAGKSGIGISFSTPERELPAVVDAERMEQLLLNLLANSLKHTKAGDSIAVSLRRAGEKVVISVDDNGEGIAQDTLSNIFAIPDAVQNPLSPESGSGLGLYIAYGIAQLHKGVLLIESREGEGTHVRVMLPSDEAPAPKFSTPGAGYKRSVSSVLTGLAEVLENDCFGPRLED